MKFLRRRFFRRKRGGAFLILLIPVILFSLVFCLYSPKEIVESVGVQNGYILMFTVSLFGGVSVIASGSYLGTLITLAAGGLNPFFLAILSGAGATFGDSVFFFLGKRGKMALTKNRLHMWAKKLERWLDSKPTWFTPLTIYLIVSLTPFPNDLLALTMGFARRSYTTVVFPLVLGNITFAFLIALISIGIF